MTRLGDVLRETGFRGAASVDFVLDGGRALLIECNPRFSSASPQLSAESSLLHGLDFFAEHLRAVGGRPLSAHVPRLPDSTFEGAYVDFGEHIAAALRAGRRRLVTALPRLGIHELRRGELRFVSTDAAALAGEGRLLFYYSTPEGARLTKKSDFGSLFTSFPLFEARSRQLVLSERGAALLAQLRAMVRVTRRGEPLDGVTSPLTSRSAPPRRRRGVRPSGSVV